MNYNDVKLIFERKKCVLLDDEDAFTEKLQSCKKKIAHHVRVKYIAQCGHDNEVTVTNFKVRGTGLLCASCVKEKVTNKMKTESKQTNITEHNGIGILLEEIGNSFEVRRTPEGCTADLILRPKDINDDRWAEIQIKTTKAKCHNMHSFMVYPHKYHDNMIIFCICIEDKRIWCFKPSDIKVKSKLNISSQSKYLKYEVTSIASTKLNELYKEVSLTNELIATTPRNKYQIREQQYAKTRKQLVPWLNYEEPNIQGLAYDFKVGDFRVQEKVCGAKATKTRFTVSLRKNNGRCGKRTFQPYSKDDFDVLWIHLEDCDMMYVIPTSILEEMGYLQSPQHKGLTCISIDVAKKNAWYSRFAYDKANIDKQKLALVFGILYSDKNDLTH